MNKKPTDSEIVKALKDKIEFENFDENGYAVIDIEKLKNTLDLINRLQCERNKYRRKVQNQREEINRLQAENERLKNILICFMGALGKVRNIDDIESISQIPIMTELNKGIRSEIKFEAYKEFANELKCRTHEISYNTMQVVNKDDIDNLLKEMVGENNG